MYQFQVSPPKVLKKPVVCREEEPARPAYLTLGTFGQTPKIHFERVQLGQSKMKILNIRNPTENDVWLKFTKKPSSKFQLSCPTENVISSKDQLVVEILWTPAEEGPCFEAFQCQSSLSGIKLSVHLMGECTPAPKKAGPTGRRRVLVKMSEPGPGPRSTSLPRANDPALQLTTSLLKPKMSMTLPRSPKLTNSRKAVSGTTTPNTSKDLQIIPTGDDENEKTMNLENLPPVGDNSGNVMTDSIERPASAAGNSAPRVNKPVLDELDNFAFPFTPEIPRRIIKVVNATAAAPVPPISEEDSNAIRRETFVVEEDSQFTQDAPMSSRRDTYLVPRTPDPEVELKPKKLDFVEEQDSVDVDSEFALELTSSLNMMNETTIIYDPACSTSLPSSDEDETDSMDATMDSLANQIVDMTLTRLNSEAAASKRPQTYHCETEMISDSDSDSEDDEDRAVASVLAEIDDLQLMLKGFLSELSVPVGSS